MTVAFEGWGANLELKIKTPTTKEFKMLPKCEKCNQGMEIAFSIRQSGKVVKTFYRCRKCGARKTKDMNNVHNRKQTHDNV